MIIAKTPFRITLAGGGTDLPSFYEKEGGFVVSMAIDKYIYIGLKYNTFDESIILRYADDEYVCNVNDLEHDRAKEALLANNLLKQIEITSTADLPAQSGMGASGSFLVAILAAIKELQNKQYNLHDICEEACHIEIDILGLPVGKQDQYIAGYGGVKVLEIDKKGHVEVSDVSHQIDMDSFIQYCNVYRTNMYRDANEILREQSQPNKQISQSLCKIKDMAYEFFDCLLTNDFIKYGRLLHEYWLVKKSLSDKISHKLIDNIYTTARSKYGVLGGKLIGAGGGGFLLLFRPRAVGLHTDDLDSFMLQQGMERLDFDVDTKGLQVTRI